MKLWHVALGNLEAQHEFTVEAADEAAAIVVAMAQWPSTRESPIGVNMVREMQADA